jgi:ribosome-binding factor A
LQSFLAEQLRKMRDPRLELVSINGLDLSGDMRVAKVYWTILGSTEQAAIDKASQALSGSEGFFRKRIAENLDLRCVPELRFLYDKTAAVGGRIDELLGQLKN